MQDLVGSAAKGDREAFAVLMSGSIDRLYAIARRMLQDHDRAEDAVQAALIDAWRDLPSLRDPARFDSWLHRLVVRACYDEARRKRAFNLRVVHAEPSTDDPTADVADREQLESAFERLTLEQRAVVVLHFYVGLPLKEVAETLGVPEGTARSRLHYALRVVRGALEADRRQVVSAGRIA